jgi:hypothetical protein
MKTIFKIDYLVMTLSIRSITRGLFSFEIIEMYSIRGTDFDNLYLKKVLNLSLENLLLVLGGMAGGFGGMPCLR